MLKKLLLALLIYGVLLYGVYFFLYRDEPWSVTTISNTLFVVGLPVFFISLIFTTNAGKLFIFIGYSLKIMFSRSLTKTTYYQYHQNKLKKGTLLYPPIFLIISITSIAVSFVILLL